MGCSQRWFKDSTMTPQCYLGSALPQLFKILPPPAQLQWCKGEPISQPQHMKVLKHFIYFQYGCGMQLAVVYSLNHDTATSFGLRLTPISKLLPPPAQVLQCKDASICPSTAHEGAQTLYIHPIWMWDAVSSGLKPRT